MEPASASGPRCVAAGVDSLYLSFYADLAEETIDLLEHAKIDAAGDGGGRSADADDVALELGGIRFAVSAHGVKCFPFLLATEAWQVSIGRRKDDASPSVFVQVLSHELWERGALEAYRSVAAWVAKIHRGEGAPRGVVSRIDLAADMVGIDPSEDDRRGFVTKARRIGAFHCGSVDVRWDVDRGAWVDAKRQAHASEDVEPSTAPEEPVDLFWVGRTFTGYRFGKDRIVFRMYDKLEEIKASRKTWFFEVWSKAGWKGERVWRCEAQVRRDMLKELRVLDESTGEILNPAKPEALLGSLHALWQYVVGREGSIGGWVQWKVRDDDEPQPSRWKVRPEWEAVRAVKFGVSGVSGLRVKILKATYDMLLPQFAGVLSTMAACKQLAGIRADTEAVLSEILEIARADVRDYYATKAKRQLKEAIDWKAFKLEAAKQAELGWAEGEEDT